MTITRNQKTPIMHRSVAHEGKVIHFGGVVAADCSVGMEGQTRQVTEQLDALLAAAGTDKSRILSALLFITDMSLKSEMNAVWTSWIDGADLPARATIGVADLGKDVLLEVVITAAG